MNVVEPDLDGVGGSGRLIGKISVDEIVDKRIDMARDGVGSGVSVGSSGVAVATPFLRWWLVGCGGSGSAV